MFGARRVCVCPTDGGLSFCEERVHLVHVSHQLSISEGEVGHVSPGLCCRHQLDQGWARDTQRQWGRVRAKEEE